jgi:hypothetical protein
MPQHSDAVPAAVADRLAALARLRPTSPKRPANDATAEAWYGYYAGYADSFVREIVGCLPSESGTVLDPWNGSGTTTSVATRGGLTSYGFDINPAAVVIAKARLLRSDVASSIEALTDEIVASALTEAAECDRNDPLRFWFKPPSAVTLRTIERRIYRLLVSSDDERRLVEPDVLGHSSSLATLFYLGLFRTVRPFLQRFVGSNPTWIKRTIPSTQRVNPSAYTCTSRFADAMRALALAVREAGHSYRRGCPSEVAVASSRQLPLAAETVDAVITSPPYCTRIDYAIATLPELAVLGITPSELGTLRDSMVGTPTMGWDDANETPPLGRGASALLRRIEKHGSEACRSYYAPFYRQYLRGMARSFAEMARVTTTGAPIILVVQDSYFKDVHVDLPALMMEMGGAEGWKPIGEHRFPVAPNRNRAAIHGRARAYRAQTPATETVLMFSAG